ncbi:hypothetical protein A3K86_20710 [Photobacterium jeanii]|uniref:Chain-length determining protein n=1 Tax=Photobacterium jeanii TaxID=858640 RepID=A0A178K261_9GAMM|nr:XrtA system polysaccharide chain length determinant [Photobacterium jeanii]OAN11371.1 hypothetical protein A3K86_20710 [Photobacterium jeanii]PST90891.1 chain length determinant family protein [Photobacterium jeanii]
MQEQLDNLIQYARGVWLKRRYALIAAWIICLLGWSVVTLLPNQYTANARVYADTRSILQPLLRGLTIETDPSQEVALMVKTLLSRSNLETIARDTDADIRATNNEEYEEILEDLKTNILIRSAGRENLFTISYSGDNPRYVRDVVQSALNVFVENALGEKRQDTDQASQFIASQIEDYEARLLKAETGLAKFKQENAGYMPGSEQNYYNRLEQLESELESTQLKLREVRTQLATARGQLSNERALASKNMSSIRTEYDERLDALETRLDALLFRFTEKHPDVKETRRQIVDLKALKSESQQSASALGGRGDSLFNDLKLFIRQLENEEASLKVRVASYNEKLAFLSEKLAKMPQVEAKMTNLMRSYDITKNKYEELLSRRESALISQSVGAAADDIKFRVIDPPRVPTEPSGPIRPLLLSMVLVVGLGAGTGVSFLSSQVSPVVTSANQLYQATSLPVFGSVSATEQSGVVKKNKRRTIVFTVIAVCLILVFATYMAMNLIPSLHSRLLSITELL